MDFNNKIKNIRRNYKLTQLLEANIDDNPFNQFSKWFDLVLKKRELQPNAMFLATATKKGKPSGRVVLLKNFDKTGFTFFTNYNSRKGKELEENPFASITFLWLEFERQVRIEGKIKKISKKESEEYFNFRPLKSRIGALASNQSEIIPDRKFLEIKFTELEKKFGKNPPMPKNWGGYKLIPSSFEFWQGREDRLHDRICYKKNKSSWKIFRLSP
jgi:pyridoxamine 5'-phosphate oxidase